MTLGITLPRDLSNLNMAHVWTNRLPNEKHLKGFVSVSIGLGGIAAVHIDSKYLSTNNNGDFTSDKISGDDRTTTPFNAFIPAIEHGEKLSDALFLSLIHI